MPKIMTCDICGAKDASEDYNGDILCGYHRDLADLSYAESEYKKKRQWIIDVWITELRERKKKINVLKKIISDYENEQKNGGGKIK